jgi:5'-3' exonuclease
MGVPAFFKWLTIRYPQVVIAALTEDDIEVYYAEFKES